MNHSTKTIELKTTAKTDIIDFTTEAESFVNDSRVKNGLFTAIIPGSTASITTIEYESGVVNDLKHAVEKLVPADQHYDHDECWGDGNGYSHVRAAFLKSSLTIPIVNGKLTIGTWQQIVLCDFDNRPRMRSIVMQVIGE